MPRFFLIAACLTLAACASTPNRGHGAGRLAEGRWSGGLTPMNHPDMVTPIAYDVAYEGRALSVTLLNPGGAPMPTRDVALRGDTLHFVFDEPDAGVPLHCALARQVDGGFGGRCTDADGKWARFTMAPPTPSASPAEPSRAAAQERGTKLQAFKSFAEEYRRDNGILSLSYAIVQDGEIVAAEGIGWQDHDAEEPTTPNTSYLAASITKTFTGATLLAMDADGVVDLDDDFTTLSDWDERCDWLSNSGNIFGGGRPLDDGYTPPRIRCDAPIPLRDVLRMRVLGEPGTNFLYNPIVFGRLANWVEEETGRPFDHWVRHYVIDKAGLENIAAGWRDPHGGDALRLLAPPFRHAPEQEDGLAPSPLPNPELNASSGIVASAVALAEYSIALDEGRILDPELREAMWTPPREADGAPAPYAYGWWAQEWRGHKLVWHGGWWPDAYAGLLLKVPDEGLTLVALGNTDGLHWGNRLQVAEVEKNPLALRFLETFTTR